MNKNLILIPIVAIILGMGGYLLLKNPDDNITQSSHTTTNTMDQKVTFNDKDYAVGFELPGGGSDFKSESYEWVTDGETVENWTSLLTTHRLSPLSEDQPLSAATYAENVAQMLEQKGALVLELSVINQDTEALGIDPNFPPYFLAYLFSDGNTIEFNMQKIVQLDGQSVGSVIYAERFPTKTEAEMQTYYESEARTGRRIELIKLPFPY